MERFRYFAVCAPGVEPLLFAEVKALRLARAEQQVGGVYFEGSERDGWRANLWLRTAVRVLRRVARFRAADADALYAGAREVDWGRYLLADGRFVVDALCKRSELSHSRFVEQRVKDAIVDLFREREGVRPDVDREGADLGVHVHLFEDRCTLSVDTSGRALHRRGWRRAQGPAPLAETLAAACVLASGWDRRAPLVDPFCGSGTIPIEAALLARGVAPGLLRERFGFETWPGHDAQAWRAERERAAAAGGAKGRGPALLARDVDPARVAEARENAEAAGVADALDFEEGDALDWIPRPGWNAWVVANLPYGRRIEGTGAGADVLDLHRRLGAHLRERGAGYRLALLTGGDREADALGLEGFQRTAILNGGIDCRLVTGRLPG